jgi:hypothetical protein
MGKTGFQLAQERQKGDDAGREWILAFARMGRGEWIAVFGGKTVGMNRIS